MKYKESNPQTKKQTNNTTQNVGWFLVVTLGSFRTYPGKAADKHSLPCHRKPKLVQQVKIRTGMTSGFGHSPVFPACCQSHVGDGNQQISGNKLNDQLKLTTISNHTSTSITSATTCNTLQLNKNSRCPSFRAAEVLPERSRCPLGRHSLRHTGPSYAAGNGWWLPLGA